MTKSLHVVQSTPLSESEALNRLAALTGEALNATHLAHEWNWSRSKVRRFIARHQAGKSIPPASSAGDAAGGQKRRAPARKPPTASSAVEPMQRVPLTAFLDPQPEPSTASSNAPDQKRSTALPASVPDFPIRALGLALGLAAITLGGVGLIVNIVFAQSWGASSAITADVMSVLFGLIDVFTIILPTVASHLWTQRKRSSALLAWPIWFGMLTMTLIAASSFAATNIGDNIEQRAKATQESAALRAKLEQMRADRARISETRSPDAIAAAIQQEQPKVPAANWKASIGCTSVTISGKECSAINALRQAKADADRRDKLDAQISAAEDAFAKLPAFSAADPGADMAARLFTLMTLGALNVAPNAIQQIRIFGLTLAPALSGILLMFAAATWRTHRDEFPPLL
ncbi:hypothetical protein [Bradyrhizobium sp. STM 3809]|uniref:hypothetical protein n=1 Tax=Bradyrhizobium sp. STM 3809 TaxID=551936 RepID=UPI0002406544|nr:hypothetical protein [Bradyrhizobium sp. STM 3809]CCD97624.1 conserved membrane hypothetical protein [Bradyrhizobium sp. STM 3809]